MLSWLRSDFRLFQLGGAASLCHAPWISKVAHAVLLIVAVKNRSACVWLTVFCGRWSVGFHSCEARMWQLRLAPVGSGRAAVSPRQSVQSVQGSCSDKLHIPITELFFSLFFCTMVIKYPSIICAWTCNCWVAFDLLHCCDVYLFISEASTAPRGR